MAAVLLTASALSVWSFTADDAFIFFRYAENAAAGSPGAYNIGGPATEGYTSPLWLMVLTAGALAGVDLVVFSKVAGVLAMFGAIYVLMKFVVFRRAATGVALLAILPVIGIHAVSGMDTALTTLFLSVFLLNVSGMDKITPVTGFLLSMCRPEYALFVLLVLAATSSCRKNWTPTLIFVGMGAIYFIGRLIVFGEVLPLPYYVKTGGNNLDGTVGSVMFFAALLLPMFWMAIEREAKSVQIFFLALIPLTALYAFTDPVMNYDWRYLFPPLFVSAGMAISSIDRTRGYRKVVVAALSVQLAFLFFQMQPRVENKLRYAEGLQRAHVTLGKHLSQLDPRNVLLISDAGAVPYYSKLHTIDMLGLNYAKIAKGGAYDGPATVMVLISSDSTRFQPVLKQEEYYWQQGTAAGMVNVATLTFQPGYYLWVMASPESLDFFFQIGGPSQ